MASVRGEVGLGVVANALVWLLAALWVFNEFNYYALKSRILPRLKAPELAGLLFCLTLTPSVFVSAAPALTLYRIGQLGIGFLFASAWVRRFGIERTIVHMFYAASVLCAYLVILWVVLPSQVVFAGRLLGGALAPGPVIAAILLVLTFAIGDVVPVRHRRLMFALATVIILASRTRSLLIAALLVILIAGLRSTGRSAARRLTLFLAGLAPGVALVGFGDVLLAYVVRDTASLRNLSDRVPLWSSVLSAVWERSPLVGIGYMTSRLLTLLINPGIGSAHSLFVEVFVGAGLLGMAGLGLLLVPLVARVVTMFFGPSPTRIAFVAMALLTVVLMISVVSEEALYSSPANFALVFLPALVGASARGQNTGLTQ